MDARRPNPLSAAAAALCLAVGLMGRNSAAAGHTEKGQMQLISTAFNEGAAIPAKYTCDEQNVSPPLKWSGVPAGAKSLVLMVDDPDAPVGTWVHWVLYDLTATASELPEGVAKTQSIAGDARQGINDFKRLGYDGPCPPHGKAHRYFFKLYALDAMLGARPSAKKKDIEGAMGKHILAQGQLMGTYKRH